MSSDKQQLLIHDAAREVASSSDDTKPTDASKVRNNSSKASSSASDSVSAKDDLGATLPSILPTTQPLLNSELSTKSTTNSSTSVKAAQDKNGHDDNENSVKVSSSSSSHENSTTVTSIDRNKSKNTNVHDNNNSSNVDQSTRSDVIINANAYVDTSMISTGITSIDASTQLLNMIQDETVRQLELAWEAQQQLALLFTEKEYEAKMNNQ